MTGRMDAQNALIGSILIDGAGGADAAAAVVSAEDEESLEACAAQISAPAEYVDFLKKLSMPLACSMAESNVLAFQNISTQMRMFHSNTRRKDEST